MYQFDLAAEQLSTDLTLSPSPNSLIQLQLEMSLEKRRGISCVGFFFSLHSWHKREGKRERKCESMGGRGKEPGSLSKPLKTGLAEVGGETLYPPPPEILHSK